MSAQNRQNLADRGDVILHLGDRARASVQILRCAQDDEKEKQDDEKEKLDDRSDVLDDRPFYIGFHGSPCKYATSRMARLDRYCLGCEVRCGIIISMKRKNIINHQISSKQEIQNHIFDREINLLGIG